MHLRKRSGICLQLLVIRGRTELNKSSCVYVLGSKTLLFIDSRYYKCSKPEILIEYSPLLGFDNLILEVLK